MLTLSANAIGGVRQDGRDAIQAGVAIYHGCLAYNVDDSNSVSCRYYGLRPQPELYFSTLYGYVMKTDGAGSQAIFWGCVNPLYNEHGMVGGCTTNGLRASADPWGYSSVVGYVSTVHSQAAKPIYNGCLEMQETGDHQPFCAVSGLRTTPDPWGWSSQFGEIDGGN